MSAGPKGDNQQYFAKMGNQANFQGQKQISFQEMINTNQKVSVPTEMHRMAV